MHLNSNLDCQVLCLIVDLLRFECVSLRFGGLPEFSKNVYTSNKHLRFPHSESEMLVRHHYLSAIFQYFDNWIAVENTLSEGESWIAGCSSVCSLTMRAIRL